MLDKLLTVTETQALVLPAGTYQESGGQVVMEGENGQSVAGVSHQWITATAQSGYTGTAYLQASPDIDQLYQTSQITSSPRAEYAVNFTTPGTYAVWLRGYPTNVTGDSVYVNLRSQTVGLTGFTPGQWSWARLRLDTAAALTLTVQSSGLYTLNLRMREDGLNVDRLLLTTNTTFIPTGFGPAESSRFINQTTLSATITRTIVYTYDDLYRLTNANYSSGQVFTYTYDPASNRKTQTTLAGTNVYTYDAANRLTQVDGVTYNWDNNGNLLSDGQRTFTYDSADRLTSVISGGVTTQFTYNGDGDRLAQTVAGVAINYVLDPVGLAEVLIENQGGQSLYALPGLAQYDGSTWAYFAKDRLGSIRHLVDPSGQVALLQSYDPFGNLLEQSGSGPSLFGYTGEQMDATGLVFLRARYYQPVIGRFLTADSLVPDPLHSIGWNRYAYANNNPILYVDPSGHQCELPMDEVGGPLLFNSTCLEGSVGRASSGSTVSRGHMGGNSSGLSGRGIIGAAIGGALLGGLMSLPEGFTLDEGSHQCYLPGADISIPGSNPWGTLSFPLTPPYFGPVVPPFLSNPGTPSNIVTANIPTWVRDAGTTVGWAQKLQRDYENTKVIPTKETLDALVSAARKYGVKVRQDPAHPGTPWNIPHLNIGKKGQAHVPIPPGYKLP